MRRVVLGVMVLGAMLGAAVAAANDEAVAIRIVLEDRGRLEELSRLVSIDDVRGGAVTAVATPAQLARLDKAGFRWEAAPSAA